MRKYLVVLAFFCFFSFLFFWEAKANPDVPLATSSLFNDPQPFYKEHAVECFLIALLTLALGIILCFYLRLRRFTYLRQNIFSSLPLSICIVDRNGNVLYWQENSEQKQYLRQLGIERFANLTDFPGMDREQLLCQLHDVLDSGKRKSFEFFCDGRCQMATCTPYPFFFGQEAVLWSSCDVDDLVQERLAAEQPVLRNVSGLEEHGYHISDSLQALRYAARLTKISYFRTDDSGTFKDFNHDGRENWGFDGDRILSWREWVHEDDAVKFRQQWELLLTGKVDEFQLSYRSNEKGQVRYFVMLAAVLNRESGEKQQYFGVIQDITALGENERKLNDANALFKTILDVLPCMLFIKDASDDYKFTLVNKLCGKMVGVGEENLIGRTDFDIFDRTEAERFRAADCDVVEREVFVAYTEELKGKNQNYFIHTVKTTLETSDRHKLLIGLSVDVTELERHKRKLAESEQLLRAAFDHIPVGLFLKDPEDDYRYVIWNNELAKNAGISESMVEGKKDREIDIFADFAEKFHRMDCRVMEQMTVWEGEEEIIGRDLERIIYRTTKMPITLSSGKRYLLGTCVNFTRRKQLENELQQTIQRQNGLIQNEKIFNQCLRLITFENDFDTVVGALLKTIGEKSGADRCTVFYQSFQSRQAAGPVEWTKENIPAQLDVWRGFDWESIPELFLELMENDIIQVDDFANFPGLRTALIRHAGEKFDTRSMLVCGIKEQGKLWGFLCLEYVDKTRKFTREDRELLNNASQLFLLAKIHARQQEALDESIHARKMIFNNIKIPILLFDAQGNLINVNPAACRLADSSENEIFSRPCFDSFCRMEGIPGFCPVRKVLVEGKQASLEMTLPDGSEYLISAEPIFNEKGAIAYIIESALNITQINESKRRLTEAVRVAQAADRAKSNFIATMSHELRTPLNAVIGFSELLQRENMEEQERFEYLKSINLAGNTLLGLINDILDLSKLDAEQMIIEPEKMNLSGLLEELAAIFKYRLREKNLTFATQGTENLPWLYLDTARLRQILLNLIGNAVKFTHQGGIVAQVQFCASDSEYGELTIDVLDTGIGVKPESMSKIFEPFIQDDAVRGSRAYQGTGLGLAISRRLTRAMGGELSLRGYERQGSCFTVFLKHVKYSLKEDLPVSFPKVEVVEPSAVNGVLLVDDVPMNLKVLVAMLGHLGYRCVCANSGKEALACMEKEVFEVVLTDMWMPEMDGEKLAEKIRNVPAWNGVKIFAVTADMEWDEAAASKLFDGVLYKPVELEALKRMLKNAGTDAH